MAEELKNEGNQAFAKKDFDSAVSLYGQAIALEPDNHVLYSNRAAAYLGQEKYSEAIEDANVSIRLQPSFTKGYFRKATALQSLGDLQGCFEIWQLAKSSCDRTALLDSQLNDAKKKWIGAMRETPVQSMEDLMKRYTLLSDSREKLSTIAHFWNDSTKAERRQHFIRFLAVVGGDSGAAVDTSDVQEKNMVPMPMENYLDLPSTRITSWMDFFHGLDSAGKTELLVQFWGVLSTREQSAVIMDLRTFFGSA